MKTIIFDFGNVVGFFDHTRTLEMLRPYTALTSVEMYASVYGSEIEDEVERGRITEWEFLRKVHQLWQLSCNMDTLAHAIGDIFWANPEVCELVPKLKGRYRLLLGSNTNIVHSKHFRAQFADTLSHFDALVLSHEIGTRKPDASFFHHCLSLAEAAPDECVFVDDLPPNIAGARSAGLHGIAYRPSNQLAEQLHALGVDVRG